MGEGEVSTHHHAGAHFGNDESRVVNALLGRVDLLDSEGALEVLAALLGKCLTRLGLLRQLGRVISWDLVGISNLAIVVGRVRSRLAQHFGLEIRKGRLSGDGRHDDEIDNENKYEDGKKIDRKVDRKVGCVRALFVGVIFLILVEQNVSSRREPLLGCPGSKSTLTDSRSFHLTRKFYTHKRISFTIFFSVKSVQG